MVVVGCSGSSAPAQSVSEGGSPESMDAAVKVTGAAVTDGAAAVNDGADAESSDAAPSNDLLCVVSNGPMPTVITCDRTSQYCNIYRTCFAGAPNSSASCSPFPSAIDGDGDAGAGDAANPASLCPVLTANCDPNDVCPCSADDAGGLTVVYDDTYYSCSTCYGAPPARLHRLRA
jgi:hypothetical protein